MVETHDISAPDQLQILLSGIIWSLLILGLASRFGYFKLEKTHIFPDFHFPLKILLAAFFVFLTVQLFLIPFISLLWLYFEEGVSFSKVENLDPITRGWFNIVSIVGTGGAIMLFLSYLQKKYRECIWGVDAFQGFKKWARDISVGLATWVICFPILIVISQSMELFLKLFGIGPRFEQVAVKQLKMTFETPSLFWTMTLMIIFIVPVIEEILFRGILQNWAKGVMGIGKGIAFSAATFALFHFSYSQGWDNLSLLTSLFVLGGFLGFIYERQRSLWASISLHATFNAISIWMIAHVE